MQAAQTISNLQLALVVAIPTVTALVGILISYSQNSTTNARLTDLQSNLIQMRNQTHEDISMLTGKIIEIMGERH